MRFLRKMLEASLEIFFRPRATFDKIHEETSLVKMSFLYLFSCLIGTALIYLMEAYSESGWISVGAFFWLAVFHQVQLFYAFFASQFNFGTMLSQTFPTYYYPYFALAGILCTCVFYAIVNITVQRLFHGKENYKNLLKSIFFLAATAAIFIPLFGGIAGLLLQFKAPFFDPLTILSFSPFIIWSAFLTIIAIERAYNFPFRRAAVVWVTTVLLFPVSIFITLLSAIAELTYPIRAQRRVSRLRDLHRDIQQMQAQKSIDIVVETEVPNRLQEFVATYQEDTTIGDKVRKRIQLSEFLFDVARANREDVLQQIINLSRHNRTHVRLEAATGLKRILEQNTDTAIQDIQFLIENGCHPEIFWDVSEIPEETLMTKLCRAYYYLQKGAKGLLSGDGNPFGNMVNLLEETQGIKHGRELFLVYRSLYHLSKAQTIDNIIEIEPDIVEILGYDDAFLVEAGEIFKRLSEVIGNLTVYERVDLADKLPYLAVPLMILIDIGNNPRQPEIEKKFELQIIKPIMSDLQDIFVREFERIKGQADLEFDLKSKKVLLEDEVTLLLAVRNGGSAVAEDINLRLVPQSDSRFSTVSAEETIRTLSPQREAQVEFTIKPLEEGRLNIRFEIEYNDLERKRKTLQFADRVEVSRNLEEKAVQTVTEFDNPYIVGPPVGSDMFFGREDVFQFIGQRLRDQSQKTIIILRGQRRTGKTSVLLQLEHRLNEKYIPVFMDMQGFTDSGMDRFLYQIAYAIVDGLEEHNIYIEPPQLEQFSDAPGIFFRNEFLNQVLDKIEYRHLLLLFDEFEQLEKRVKDGKLDEDIFPFLRNLMQHTKRLDFIFAGTHQLQDMTQDYWSILFNIAVYQDITFMKRDEAEALIKNPVKDTMDYDELAVNKIIQVTAGYPYFVQLLCSVLTDYYINTKKYYITLQDVNRSLNDVLEGGAVHFDFLWKEASPDEQLILAILANVITREGAAAGLSDVENTLKKYELTMEPYQVIEIVKSLVTRGILKADSETFRRYEFQIDLIRRWVKRYQSLGIITDTLKRGNSIESQIL